MRTRIGSHDDVPADDALESWIRDLADGDSTVHRLPATSDTPGAAAVDPDDPADAAAEHAGHRCAVCCGTSTGEIWFGPDGLLPGRLSA